MAMTGIFRPKYAPAGMTWQEAKATGVLRETETYWIRYRAHGRLVRESAHSTRYEDARGLLRKRLAEVEQGIPIRPQGERVTFTELADLVRRDYREQRLDIDTLEARLAHLLPVFGPRRVMQITARDVEAYKGMRLEQKAAPGTVNRELNVFGRTLSLGVDRDLIPVAPLRVSKYRMAEAEPRQGFLTDEQFQAVMRHLPEHLRPVALFGYLLGWRRRAITERQWKDVDLATGAITMPERSRTKNWVRTVIAPPELLAVLRDQRAKADRLAQERGRLVPWIFFRPDGRPILSFDKAWATACDAAGCLGRVFHDLRRSAARGLIRRGVDRDTARKITGHRTDRIFSAYNVTDDADVSRAAAQLAGAVSLAAVGLEAVSKVSGKVQSRPARRRLTVVG